MYQHPIPQNVTQYEFRLIGSLTIKQFIFAGAGILIAYIIFKLSFIPSIFRLPLSFLFGGGGILIALVPYEGRSLDVWIVNFFKSIYSPTEYIWKKDKKLPDFFSYKKAAGSAQSFSTKKPSSTNLGDFISSINQTKPLSSQDKIEAQKLDKISNLFASDNSSTPKNTPPKITQTAFNQKQAAILVNPLAQKQKTKPSKVTNLKPNIKTIPLPRNAAPAPSNPPPAPQAPKKPAPKPNPKAQNSNTSPTQIGDDSFISKAPSLAPPVEIKSIYKDKNPVKFSPEFVSDLQVPITAEKPNIITGMTINADEKLIPNTIVEIKDKNNLPVRAIKSNNLSQFSIASPLNNGTYKIYAEHPEYSFATIEVNLNGNILPPIKLIGKPIKQNEK